MSKELEELKQIGFYVGTILGLEFENGNGAFSEIHKQDYENFKTKLNTIEQALLKAQEQEKVLEIIKRVYIDLCFILSFDTFEEYHRACNLIQVYLKCVNKDEFELLKEYFKNEN